MLYPFFEQAGRSEPRQRTFRRLASAHLLLLGGAVVVHGLVSRRPVSETLGFTMLVAGIVEGAMLLGWRLTQLPKSRSLEPLLLSPLPAPQIMLGEQLVGLAMLLLVTLTGVPLLAAAVSMRWMHPLEAALLPAFAFTWGCVAGLGLSWWAYEPLAFRRWGERLALAVILIYLVIGGLAGEHTLAWLMAVNADFGLAVRDWFVLWNTRNPFALIHRIAEGREPSLLRETLQVEAIGLGLILVFLIRAAFRLKGHYIERHYKPVSDAADRRRGSIADRPLAWWAVKRVSEYPGSLNLWLALGASGLYAAFILAGDHWPSWMGRGIFHVFDLMGGVAGLTAALALLTALPGAYQYGLWDSSVPERCRRLEMLLLTELRAGDYLGASWSAAWYRGRGYFVSAALLWGAAALSGRHEAIQVATAVLAAVVLIALYFAVGFRFFARSTGNTTVGFLLSLGLPLLTWGLGAAGFATVARALPPGMVYYALGSKVTAPGVWIPLIVWAFVAAWLITRSLRLFDRELRAWYDANHGKR